MLSYDNIFYFIFLLYNYYKDISLKPELDISKV
jgi:hypothetical protein